MTKLPSFEHHLGLPVSSKFLPHDYHKPFNLNAEKAKFTEQIIVVYEQLTVHLTTMGTRHNLPDIFPPETAFRALNTKNIFPLLSPQSTCITLIGVPKIKIN